MNYLLDTHLLLWLGSHTPGNLSPALHQIVSNAHHQLYFSAASVWEVAIKNGLNKPSFSVNPHVFRSALLQHGYRELPITSAHAAAVSGLASHHNDPFDRILIAQATVEGIVLLTNDQTVASYQGHPIQLV